MSATSTAAVSGGNTTYKIDYEVKALELTFYLVTQLHWIWRHYPGRVAGTEKARRRRVGGYLRQHKQGIVLLDLPRRPEIHFGMDCRWSRFSAQGRPLARRSRSRLRTSSCPRSRLRTPCCPWVTVEVHRRRLQNFLNIKLCTLLECSPYPLSSFIQQVIFYCCDYFNKNGTDTNYSAFFIIRF